MHLRVEAAQPYMLFPTKSTFVNPPQQQQHHSSLGYQPFSSTLPYPQQQQGYSYAGGFNSTVKRSSSAFEPLFYQQQQAASTSNGMEKLPTLADFAATIIYLMWHARKPSLMATTKASSPYRHSFSSVSGNASPAFKRFCLQVLTATQLSESAVFLALKYIANLLEANPSIEGAEGSEYRLFIVALMLANKFLDDNTFTNKTWSEVSGMKVQDLNIMESEFLEALEYNLFVREEQYTKWKSALDTCRQRYAQQNTTTMMMPENPIQRQELIAFTLHSLGLYKTSSGEKTAWDEQQHHDYIETDDDDDDDDEDEVDDEEELFQMMHHQQTLRQQEEQQRAMWSAAASATRVQLEQSQRQYQLYLMQQEQQKQQQYRHQSITTPPLTLSSSSSYSRQDSTNNTPSTNTTRTGGRTFNMQPGPYSSHRATSVYRSTSIPPGFQRRSSPWEPLVNGRYGDRCGDSFYSHQPFHPYQRQVTIVPPPSLRATCAWGE